MPNGYDHWLTITRPSDQGGAQDQTTGAWVPATAEPDTIYDGPADVQDRGKVFQRDAQGVPTQAADLSAYLPDGIVARRAIPNILPDDVATVYWTPTDPTTAEAFQVVQAQRLDVAVFLRRTG